MEQKPMNFESSFNINKLSFGKVNSEFEHKFKERYSNSLSMMSDSRDRFTNSRGANSLGVLEKMAQRMEQYDDKSDFEQEYHAILKEFEPFTET